MVNNLKTFLVSFYVKGVVMGQFSKFICPGYYRVQSIYQPNSGIFVQAFKGSEQDVIVVTNKNITVKSQTFKFNNENIESATKYVTSSTKKIANEGEISSTNNSFTDNLDSKSITTYIVKRVLSVVNESKNINISIFPNSAENYLKLSTVENINVLNVCNLFGQKLITINNPQVQTINIIGL